MTVHIYTQTTHRTTQITTNVEECGPCPVFASFTLAFVLQLRKKHGKTSVSVRKKNSNQVKKNLSQSTVYIYQNNHTLQNPHKHTHYKTHTYAHVHTHTQTHILQNNIKLTKQCGLEGLSSTVISSVDVDSVGARI